MPILNGAKVIAALVLATCMTSNATAFPQQSGQMGHDSTREREARSAAFQKRQAAVVAHNKKVVRDRVEDKAAWKARQGRIEASKVKATQNRAERKADWKKLAAHRAAVEQKQAGSAK